MSSIMRTLALLAALAISAPAGGLAADRGSVVVTKRYSGPRVDIDFTNGDVRRIVRLLGSAAGFRVLAGADVKGVVTIKMKDAPWDEVFDAVVRRAKLVYELDGKTIHVRAAAK
jgi:type IV pilus assembly protein PilQ